jgi:hypothetical protein
LTHDLIAPPGGFERVQGRTFAELAVPPWTWGPPHSVHGRGMAARFGEAGVPAGGATQVGVAAPMLLRRQCDPLGHVAIEALGIAKAAVEALARHNAAGPLDPPV